MVTRGQRAESTTRGSGGVFIALGSNLGDRARHLRDALSELDASDGVRVLQCSKLHETRPEGGSPGQPLFLNAAAELDTTRGPDELLNLLLEIEQRHGRRRNGQNMARTLDLDLLLYRDLVIDAPGLIVPHPRMWRRAFVMGPLSEIAPPELLGVMRRRTRGRPVASVHESSARVNES